MALSTGRSTVVVGVRFPARIATASSSRSSSGADFTTSKRSRASATQPSIEGSSGRVMSASSCDLCDGERAARGIQLGEGAAIRGHGLVSVVLERGYTGIGEQPHGIDEGTRGRLIGQALAGSASGL